MTTSDLFEDLRGSDEAAREAALDVGRSWLVQAPAGSGKTGLLIQRYLALLARVEAPERVVAMTFTRKAAAEMRERVIEALAAADEPLAPRASPHDRRTRELARAVLAQDRRHGWQLTLHPARLRINTIDAFTTALARAAPLSTAVGALPRFVDDAQALHEAAARAALAHARPDDPAWRTFLQWLDNDARLAVSQLAQMLAAREQWPFALKPHDADALRADIERVLAAEICAELERVRARFPFRLVAPLVRHARQALEHFEAQDPDSPRARMLRSIVRATGVPAATADALPDWCELAGWLLTQKGTPASPTVRHGFPAKGTTPHAEAQKAAFVAWLTEAGRVPGLFEALHGVRELPPAAFGAEAWQFVAAVLEILPQVAAELVVAMAQRREADFTEATLRALEALGTGDAPGDLLLAVDARIDHLLVDEFQDTSNAQLELVERLTAGWQPGDGRTLFVVGDPMQSIYRFRAAEVRIFMNAQAQGRIGDVPVGTLELARNFRSRARIVQWVNEVFGRVLPALPDAARAEVAYRSAEPEDARPAPAPSLTLCADREEEAQAVVRHVRAAQAEGARSVAVLVRARTHVDAILPALRDAGIAYHAVELEPVQERLPTRDLVWLARALAQPGDRLAWLAVLRAPWCGLSLADLLVLAARDTGSILAALDDAATLAKLSRDGALRAARLRAAVAPALDARGRTRFALRVRAAWLALGGPGATQSALDLAGTDRLFALLDAHERAGDLPDFDAFVSATERLYATLPGADLEGVQVMTLHKAKGLEFDAVVLPGLDRSTKGGQPPLLRWKARDTGGQRTLVIAPVRGRVGAEPQPDPICEWLRRLDQAEEAAELGRLLYVGATRARGRLHLLAVGQIDTRQGEPTWKRPDSGSALERLWDALAQGIAPPAAAPAAPGIAAADEAADDAAPTAAPLTRMPPDWPWPVLGTPLPTPAAPPAALSTPTFEWAEATAAAIGTVAHRLLAHIGREGIAAWEGGRLARAAPRIRADLALAGVPASERYAAVARVTRALERTLADPRGRWLFDPSHAERRTEWMLAGRDAGHIAHVALDYTFVAEGVRWIVDYKTGSHEGGDPEAFLDRELERYRPQLERYGRLVRGLDARPIRLALYYPLVEGGFRSLEFAG